MVPTTGPRTTVPAHPDPWTTGRYLRSTLAVAEVLASPDGPTMRSHGGVAQEEGRAENTGAASMIDGRGEWIRTTDLLLPKQAR